MVTFLADPVEIVPKVNDVQMGVTIQLGGQSDFFKYLETQVEDNNLNEDERLEYEEKYDGYQMLWAFDTPAITPIADGAIDAACISSASGKGGFCAGVEYKGTNTR